MNNHRLEHFRAIGCESLRNSFSQVPIPPGAKRPLNEELSREIFQDIRRLAPEKLPFFLSEILIETTRKPDRSLINDVIEFLDFNLSSSISDSEHKETWGEKGLEVYKQTTRRQLDENCQIASLLSKEQANAILCWLYWVEESSDFDWWRKEQLEGAIKYWRQKGQA